MRNAAVGGAFVIFVSMKHSVVNAALGLTFADCGKSKQKHALATIDLLLFG